MYSADLAPEAKRVTVIGTFWVTVPMSVESVTQTLYVPASIVPEELPAPLRRMRAGLEPAHLHERERVATVPDLHGHDTGLPDLERDRDRVAYAIAVRREVDGICPQPGQRAQDDELVDELRRPAAVTARREQQPVAAVGQRVGSPGKRLRTRLLADVARKRDHGQPALVLQLGADRGRLAERVAHGQQICVAVAVGRDDARLWPEIRRHRRSRGRRGGGAIGVAPPSTPLAGRTPSASIVHR